MREDMIVTIAPNGYLQIDNARIKHRNFEGRATKYSREGERSFSLIIPDEETKELLVNDLNRYGVGWTVKIKPPYEEGGEPQMHLPVKVKFNNRGPHVYLITNGRRNKLDEESIGCLDSCDISHIDMDIRPYDDEFNGRPFRTAYLHAIEVTQEVDRFEARYAEEEFPGEDVF